MPTSRRLGLGLHVLAAAFLALFLLAAGSGVSAAQPRVPYPEPLASTLDYPPGTPGPFKIRNGFTGYCLDSSTDGNYRVYHGECNDRDAGQKWGWWNGGWLINLETGYCVSERRLSDGTAIRLESCELERYDYWTHTNLAIQNKARGTCVTSGPIGSQIRAVPCLTSIYQTWRVTYW